MPSCIYCGDERDATGFKSREHVLPDAFGRFSGALTLTDPVVCDACNAEFSRTLDIYLARDTPIGLARYLFGQKKPDEYKHLGRRATLHHRIDEGRLAGAAVTFAPGEEILDVRPLPQIGFGATPDGPFQWFLCSALPSKEQIRILVESGRRYVEFLEVLDMDGMLGTLSGLGLKIDDARETAPAGSRGVHRTETSALLTQMFGRAIAKIGMNYLASQHGAAVARMAAFDAVRRYIRFADPMPRGTWWPEAVPRGFDHRQHVLVLYWESARRRAVVDVCFFGTYRDRVVLAEGGGFLMNPPFEPRGHRYNLVTMTVEAIPKSSLSS
jgi:HNH endonuclease